MTRRIVFYSSNSKHREKDSNCTVFPKWAKQWDKVASRHPEFDIILVVQLNGRYFLDIRDGELIDKPSKIKVKILPEEATIPDFLAAVGEEKPDTAVAIPGPVSGYDWNGLRDACIAEGLRNKGIDTICYSTETAMDCFDKWRTHQVLKAAGFSIPNAFYLHYELFKTNKLGKTCTTNVYREYVFWELQNMDMPVVIKNTTGSSSVGLYIAKDYEKTKEYLLSDQLREDVIIEQFLDGVEYGAEVHGDRGNYCVSPPFRIFNIVQGQFNEPFGATTIKYGPILDDNLHIDLLRKELGRMAELMHFSGVMEIDLVYKNGKWYVLEINNRWSGLTTLITASQGRLPYDVYMDEVTGSSEDYNDFSNLNFACQFKMKNVEKSILEKIAAEPGVKSVIQYELRHPGQNSYWFNDVVMGGYESISDLIENFDVLQKKYPEQISEILVKALREREG